LFLASVCSFVMAATLGVSGSLLVITLALLWEPLSSEYRGLISSYKGVARIADCQKQFQRGRPSDPGARARLRAEVLQGLSDLLEGTTTYQMLTEEYGWSHDPYRFDRIEAIARTMADELRD